MFIFTNLVFLFISKASSAPKYFLCDLLLVCIYMLYYYIWFCLNIYMTIHNMYL